MSRYYRYQSCDGVALTACPGCQADLTKPAADQGIVVETMLGLYKALLQDGEIVGVGPRAGDLLNDLNEGLLVRIGCGQCVCDLDAIESVERCEAKKVADNRAA